MRGAEAKRQGAAALWIMCHNAFPHVHSADMSVPNPIFWPAGQMGTTGNEVNPMHRPCH